MPRPKPPYPHEFRARIFELARPGERIPCSPAVGAIDIPRFRMVVSM